MIDWPTRNVGVVVNAPCNLLMLFLQDPSSESVQEVRAEDEDAAPDVVLPLLEQYPLNTTFSIADPLTPPEIAREHPHVCCRIVPYRTNVGQEMGILAAQLVSDSDAPLKTLKQLVHDFPRYATSLSRRVIPQSDLLEEIASNSHKIQPGVSAVWLNGAQLSSEDMNPYRYSPCSAPCPI
jgi:UDP-glucose:glycoprotein glucosyltransferase